MNTEDKKEVLRKIRESIDKKAYENGEIIYFHVRCGRRKWFGPRKKVRFSLGKGVLHCIDYEVVDGKIYAPVYGFSEFLFTFGKLDKILKDNNIEFQVTKSIADLEPLLAEWQDEQCEALGCVGKHGR